MGKLVNSLVFFSYYGHTLSNIYTDLITCDSILIPWSTNSINKMDKNNYGQIDVVMFTVV